MKLFLLFLMLMTQGCTYLYVETDRMTAVGWSCFQELDIARLTYKGDGTNVLFGVRELRRTTETNAVKAVAEGTLTGIIQGVK